VNIMSSRGLLLQIDDFHGDCRHPRYAGWIDLLWFSFGGKGEFGQYRPAQSASMKMSVGRTSTDLKLAYRRGDRFRSAGVRRFRSCPPYFFFSVPRSLSPDDPRANRSASPSWTMPPRMSVWAPGWVRSIASHSD
jgi:hypothetical protein